MHFDWTMLPPELRKKMVDGLSWLARVGWTRLANNKKLTKAQEKASRELSEAYQEMLSGKKHPNMALVRRNLASAQEVPGLADLDGAAKMLEALTDVLEMEERQAAKKVAAKKVAAKKVAAKKVAAKKVAAKKVAAKKVAAKKVAAKKVAAKKVAAKKIAARKAGI
jgi:hypothetical protein